MGGGFFDNMWDPYSGAYAYPRAQPRRQQNRRGRGPRNDHRARSSEPAARSSCKVEEPLKRKPVKTFPISDRGAPVAVSQEVGQEGSQAPVKPVVARFQSDDAAATKIQAAYRGYAARKTQPLKHLRVIQKVKEELDTFKRKLEEPEQRKKLARDSLERLRWTEGIMALLLRLDSLQGSHPDVRLIRKALTKELIRLQEMIDSMSNESTESNEQDDVSTTEKEQAEAIDVLAPELSQKAKIEESISEELSSVHHDSARGVRTIEVRDLDSNHQGIRATKKSTPEKHVRQVHSNTNDQVINSVPTHSHDQSGLLPGLVDVKSMIGEGSVPESSSTEAHAEVPLDVENHKEQILTTVPPHPVEDEAGPDPTSSHNAPSTDTESDNQETPPVDVSESISEEDRDATVTPAIDNDVAEICEQAPDTGRGEEAETTPTLSGVNGVTDPNPNTSACRAGSESTDRVQGCTIPSNSMSLEPPQRVPSDHALLLQVLEENRRLKDGVERLLQWGKQQNDVIHNLASRIEQLEESKLLLHGAEDDGRKKIAAIAACPVGHRGRSRRRAEKGRRSGKAANTRPQLGVVID